MSLFAPRLPADIERMERDRIAKRSPHLALVGKDPRPDPEHFKWLSTADLVPVEIAE